jgi:hypothetical protein
MHPAEVKARALALIEQGINDCEISRRTGIPRSTVRDWRRPTYVPKAPLEACLRCWQPTRRIRFAPADYAELLGLYLGDGCISAAGRTWRLRIALDARYPKIITDATGLLERSFPENNVGRVQAHGGTMFFVSVYSRHLPCVLPQHGDGRKHERTIRLEDWQQKILAEAPWPFIRGCIRTDGCAFINRTNVHRDKPYEYLSYQFSNMSTDIVELFLDACHRVGVFTRTNRNPRGLWCVRINRRASVGLMREHVGLKS